MLSVAEDYIDVVMISLIIIIIITEADEAKHGHMGCTYRAVCVCLNVNCNSNGSPPIEQYA